MDNLINGNCKFCKKEIFYTKRHKRTYCSSNCNSLDFKQKKIKGTEGIDFVICEICGLKYKEINNNHLENHNITKFEYDEKYGNRTSEKTRKNKNTLTKLMTTEFSEKLSNSHKKEHFIKKYGEKQGKLKYDLMIEKLSYSQSKEFHISKYGEEIGNEKYYIKNKKKGMTLENQIKKYGEINGTEKYNIWLEKQKNKNTLSYYIDIFGYENGLNKWFERNNKISTSNSKIDKSLKKDYINYCNIVNRFTRLSLQINDIENIKLRGLEYGYDLDHKISKLYGFLNKIKPEIIGHYSNLEIIHNKINRSKQEECSITINEIISKYSNDLNYISKVGLIHNLSIENV